jgi:hypothetical protein
VGYGTVSMPGSLERVLHCWASGIVSCKPIFTDPEQTLTLEINEWCSCVLHEANFEKPIAVDTVDRNGNDIHKIAYLWVSWHINPGWITLHLQLLIQELSEFFAKPLLNIDAAGILYV